MRVVYDTSRVDSSGYVMVEAEDLSSGLVPLSSGLLAVEQAQAIVLADFTAANEGELSAKVGEKVVQLQSPTATPEGWPSAYDGVGFLAGLSGRRRRPSPPKPPQPQPTDRLGLPEERIYVAHVAFEPEDTESEMRMRTGDRVMLLQPHDGSGWAEVELLSSRTAGWSRGLCRGATCSSVLPMAPCSRYFRGRPKAR